MRKEIKKMMIEKKRNKRKNVMNKKIQKMMLKKVN
jgi:hypothetical protein